MSKDNIYYAIPDFKEEKELYKKINTELIMIEAHLDDSEYVKKIYSIGKIILKEIENYVNLQMKELKDINWDKARFFVG